MFGSAAAMLALSQARAYAAIVILTCITGSLAELYRPASYALLGDLVPEEHRVVAFGLYRFAVNLGFVAGPATAGFLADHSFALLSSPTPRHRSCTASSRSSRFRTVCEPG